MLNRVLGIQMQQDDSLALRRRRSLSLLLLILIGISIPLALVDPLLTGNAQGLIINGAAILLFLTLYLINRSGQLALALTLLLAGFALIPIGASVSLGTPFPQIFFPCLVVVIAAAFGSPRAPLIWAAIASLLPFIINLVLYGAVLPPAGPIVLPDGAQALPILVMELIAVGLYWMLAGISWLAGRQLYDTIAEGRAATQVALTATDSLIAQQADLAARNEQLNQVRQELEALVAALAVPVVPVADGIGLLPLVGSFDMQRLAEVERKALSIVSEQRMNALVIDLSGAGGLRDGGAEAIVRLCAALRLLGVTPVLAGLGPQGALALSSTELMLPRTAATVQDALSMLQPSK
ncbi:MAG TPA: STAS domain-containing protein [Roseiflexaceae bacterium]|nr:STAS domain-containing protein [Roseiflexaceae bacterium]